ncbi:MAG: amidohydrolase family protein [Sandaracinaceae bacterium]
MRRGFVVALMWLCLGCAGLPEAGSGDAAPCTVIENARHPGGAPARLVVQDGVVVISDAACGEVSVIDAEGRTLVPAVIDAHVHLSYYPVDERLASVGVAAAVDLACPMSALGEPSAIAVLRSGPMITAPAGYPTRSWGRDGYGLECDGAEACAAAVDLLVQAGAAVLKVPLDHGPALSDAALEAVATRAHAHDRAVFAHALDDASAARAAAFGLDVLAHTPVAPLEEHTVEAWSAGAVVSTLAAFGGSSVAVENLRRLHAAGAQVLYGTDMGNSRVAGIDPREIALLEEAGLDGPAILDAATRAPANRFGLANLGHLEPGAEASLLLLDGDPHAVPMRLASPSLVMHRGVVQP